MTTLVEENFRLLGASTLKPLTLQGKTLLPIVQGGMGVGVSAHSLAGSVAACGGVGTIASVDLRHLHPDLQEKTHRLKGPAAKAVIDAANIEALRREIVAAKLKSQGAGLIAVNVMKALTEYASYVNTALEHGADLIVVGAGLPLDLPDLAEKYPNVGLIPILSDARGVQIVLKKWLKKDRPPAAIIIEHPAYAGGHLGASGIDDLKNERFSFEKAVPETIKLLESFGLSAEVPIIVAGGVRTHADILKMQALGAAAVQMGTAFAVTMEGDASDAFKHILADARDSDLVEFQSVAGLPARAVKTPWLSHYLDHEDKLKAKAKEKPSCIKSFDCLAHCGLRDGLAKMGQFCIDHHLAAAFRGDVKKGLFFRGAGELPFGKEIRSVKDLVTGLLQAAPSYST
ncbi:MAG: nitronate monooxygenase [Rhodocyclaceae bacterium]|jgi:nitronate monooxygenase|nr:nitronate monooxygenase [Rhodocyclaceae bacterium]